MFLCRIILIKDVFYCNTYIFMNTIILIEQLQFKFNWIYLFLKYGNAPILQLSLHYTVTLDASDFILSSGQLNKGRGLRSFDQWWGEEGGLHV